MINPHSTPPSNSQRRFELTTQTNAAHKPHIHHLAVAETRRPEIHPYGRRRDQVFPATLIRQEAEHEILKQAARVGEGDVGAVGGVGGLLEEDAVAGYFADVDGDGEALAWWIGDVSREGMGEGCFGGGNEQAKMVFMIGMYWCARSPETERMRIRGFRVAGWIEFGSECARSGSAVVLADVMVVRAMDCLFM